MKTVSGRVLSSKPVSLSKAARVLSKFVASDNGAAPAFAAYLKRASASFDELVQLRKELKGSAADFIGSKKHLPDGILTNETVNSVKRPSEDGLFTQEKLGASDRKRHKMSKRDEMEGREIEDCGSVGILLEKQNSEGNGSKNSSIEGGDEKKLKKKRGKSSETDMINDNGQRYGNPDAVDDIERQDGSKETKKKKKRDKGNKEDHDGAVKIEKQEQGGSLSQDGVNGDTTYILESGVDERKKHKKNKRGKEEKESSSISIGGAEQTDITSGGSGNNRVKIKGNKGKNKKWIHEENEKESGSKVEIEETDEKESRKRKHKGGGHGLLDDSEEQYRSKKKSRKNDVDD